MLFLKSVPFSTPITGTLNENKILRACLFAFVSPDRPRIPSVFDEFVVRFNLLRHFTVFFTRFLVLYHILSEANVCIYLKNPMILQAVHFPDC
jgi:hypothetical protein